MSSYSILGSIRHCNPDFQIGITWIDPLDIFEKVLDLSLTIKNFKLPKDTWKWRGKKIFIKDPAKT